MDDDADLIRRAWGQAQAHWCGQKIRVPVLARHTGIVAHDDAPRPSNAAFVEFRLEFGTLGGRPASRVIGRFGATEIVVGTEIIKKGRTE